MHLMLRAEAFTSAGRNGSMRGGSVRRRTLQFFPIPGRNSWYSRDVFARIRYFRVLPAATNSFSQKLAFELSDKDNLDFKDLYQ